MAESAAKAAFRKKLEESGYVPTDNYRNSKEDVNWEGNKGTINPLSTTSPVISHYQDDIDGRRKIKRAWREIYESDGSRWVGSVPKVFWLGWAQDIDYEMLPIEVDEFLERSAGKNGDEFSCVGYPGGVRFVNGYSLALGFVIEGEPTYAVASDAWSQEGWRVHQRVRDWYEAAGAKGVPRRPMSLSIDDLVNHVVFTQADNTDGVIGEVILDHWTVTGIVVNDKVIRSVLDIDQDYNQEALDWLENLEANYPNMEIIRIGKIKDSIDLSRWQLLAGLK